LTYALLPVERTSSVPKRSGSAATTFLPILRGYGADDMLGEPHGRWWQQALPKAHLEVVPDVGHLVVVPFWDRALAHVAPSP
jgi:pimeloyl-ACP methyl ester carboxylesterase